MVDVSSGAVIKVGKQSAMWACFSQAVVFINLIQYLGAGVIGVNALLLLQFLFWCSVFCIMMFLQLSWISYIVYTADLDYQEKGDPPTPLPTTRTKYYVPGKSGYKIEKEVEEFGGVGEESE
jgi:hypothetical protein